MIDIMQYNDIIEEIANNGGVVTNDVVKMLLEQIKIRDAIIAELQESALSATIEMEERGIL